MTTSTRQLIHVKSSDVLPHYRISGITVDRVCSRPNPIRFCSVQHKRTSLYEAILRSRNK